MQKRWEHSFIKALPFLALILLNACATSLEQINPEQEVIVHYQQLPEDTAIQEAEAILAEAKNQQLAFYAPKHFDTAHKAIRQARVLHANHASKDKIVRKVAVAEALLKNGDRVMRNIKSILEQELEIKRNLEQSNTPQIFGREYDSLLDRLNTVIQQIENGEASKANEAQASLKNDMHDLYIRSIRYNTLNEAESIMKRVKYSGGETLAPQTYQETMAVIKRADEYIRNNEYKPEIIRQLAEETLFAAKRALYITQEVATLNHKARLSLEQVVLDEEYRLYRIARALTNKDLRNNPLEVQSDLLAKAVGELNKNIQQNQTMATALRNTLDAAREPESEKVSRLQNNVENLQQQNSELLAKEALYSAKLEQLNNQLSTLQEQIIKEQPEQTSKLEQSEFAAHQVAVDEGLSLNDPADTDKMDVAEIKNSARLVTEEDAKRIPLTVLHQDDANNQEKLKIKIDNSANLERVAEHETGSNLESIPSNDLFPDEEGDSYTGGSTLVSGNL